MTVLPLLLTLLMVRTIAPAPDPYQAHVANVLLLQSKKLQKHLGITEAQRKEMNKFADKHRSKLGEYEKELGKRKGDVSKISQDPKFIAMFRDLKEGVMAQLTPTQLKRLAEVSLQQVSVGALVDGIVAKKVGLTDAQQKKIAKIYESGLSRATKYQTDAIGAALKPYEGIKPKDQAESERLQKKVASILEGVEKRTKPMVDKMRAETSSKVLAVLSPAQKAVWAELLGKPYSGGF